MSIPLDAPAVLDREFLVLRAKILELAAGLDRLDRAAGSVSQDPRFARLQRGLQELQNPAPQRAERVQQIFSLAYDEQWQTNLRVTGPRE